MSSNLRPTVHNRGPDWGESDPVATGRDSAPQAAPLAAAERGYGKAFCNDFPAPLFIWMSPAFPVGAFAYSHGLEWAVREGRLEDAATLETWIGDLFAYGSIRNDLVLLASAWRAAATHDDLLLEQTAELACALQPSAERRLETIAQGKACAAAIRASWPCAAMDRLTAIWDGEIAYPIAVGVAAAGHDQPLAAALGAYALAFASNLVSAALRLSIVGHTAAQRVVAALLPAIEGATQFAAGASLDDIGGAAFASDLASMLHETQEARLFRT